MKLEIVTRNVLNESMVRSYIHRKAHFVAQRWVGHIDSMVIRLEDETKHSPRFRGRCSITAQLHRSEIHVSARGESTYDCVLSALRKMEQAVKQDVDRHRRGARARHEGGKREFVESLAMVGDA